MHTMFFKLTAFFCILVTLLQGCKKSCQENARNYAFENRVILEARRLDTLNVGDTIVLKVLIPFNLKNIVDSNLVNIYNSKPSDFVVGISNHNRINDVMTPSGLNDFLITSKKGSFTQSGAAGIKCELGKQNDGFVFEIQVVPKKAGLVYLQTTRSFGDLQKICSVYTISNSFNNYNLNHNFYYNLTGGNISSVLLTERDFFIWVK